jgi:hypothetical protein
LRYRPLKDAADRYAAAARSAQQDFLLSMGKLDDAIRESLVNANMLKKASLQERIAGEQVKIAEFGVVLAQQQVAAVEAQIAAKKQEIADHDSLGGQFSDLFSGMTSIIGKIPGGVTDKVGTGVGVGTGLTSSEAAGMSAAAGGACVLGAMAAFVVIGVMTLDSMADAQLPRQQQLHALQDKALPVVSRSDGSTQTLLRPQDAQPISEFRLADDMTVYGLPDEALLAFEASGIETLWQLSLPPLANRLALDDLSDIELTFDLRAQYSAQLHAAHLQSQPSTVRRLSFFSTRAFANVGFEALRDSAQPSATIAFDISAIGRLSRLESNRQLRNVVLMLPGADTLNFSATSTRQGSAPVQVGFAGGLAYSNAEPLGEPGSQTPPSPLNVLAGGAVDTTFQLTIAKGAQAAALAKVQDVLLGIEYTAHV